jgi:fructokinase
MNDQQIITCIGEILWDALPSGLFLGGAPLNVCLHLHELGESAEMVSRLGDDRLGQEAVSRIKKEGLSGDYIQLDDKHETGFVQVALDAEGAPDYDIIQPVAWDFINIQEPEVKQLLENSWAVVFGSLAQRANSLLKNLLYLDCIKVLDMNLRYPHYKRKDVKSLISHCDLLKMNADELALLQEWYEISEEGEEAVRAVAAACECPTVCVTRGEHGSWLLHDDRWFEHPGYPIEVVDAVGAGDAFLAALLHGLKSGRPEDELLPFANAVGAYVARQSGANPGYSISQIESILNKQGLFT